MRPAFLVSLLNLGALLCSALALTAQTTPPLQLQWQTTAQAYRNRLNERIAMACPPGERTFPVWGTDTYTHDSSICTAAVHAGVITMEEGGSFLLEPRPGQSGYMGSRRNGVQTQNWAEFDGSFSLSSPPPPPPPPPAKPKPTPVISWQRTAVGLSPNGRRFTFVCALPAARAAVEGTDIYSWSSSICNAAVHAGVITMSRGGTVVIEMRPGPATYSGSPRNGITSVNGNRSPLGFVVIDPSAQNEREGRAPVP